MNFLNAKICASLHARYFIRGPIIRIFANIIVLAGCFFAAAFLWFNISVRIDQTWKSQLANGDTHHLEAQGHRTSDRANLEFSSESHTSLKSIPPQSEPSAATSVRTDPEIKMYRRGVTGTLLANVFTSLEAFLILFGVGAIVGILANW